MAKLKCVQWTELQDWASGCGWSCRLTNGGHLRWTHLGAIGPVYSASTTSDWRAVRLRDQTTLSRHGGQAGSAL